MLEEEAMMSMSEAQAQYTGDDCEIESRLDFERREKEAQEAEKIQIDVERAEARLEEQALIRKEPGRREKRQTEKARTKSLRNRKS